MKNLSLLLIAFFLGSNIFAQTTIAYTESNADAILVDQANAFDHPESIKKTNGEPWEKGFFIDFVSAFGSRNVWEPAIPTVQSARFIGGQLVNSNSIRLGSKWYFGDKKFQPGIQAVWARIGVATPMAFGLVTGPVDISTAVTFQPLNVGSTNLLKLSDNVGLEFNFNIGFHSSFIFTPVGSNGNSTVMQFGVLLNPNIKFRYKKFAVGIDFSFMHGGVGSQFQSAQPAQVFPYNTDFVLLGLTIGGKF